MDKEDITLKKRPNTGSMPSDVISYIYEGQKGRYRIYVFHDWKKGQEKPDFEKVVEVGVTLLDEFGQEINLEGFDTLEEAKEKIKELEEEQESQDADELNKHFGVTE